MLACARFNFNVLEWPCMASPIDKRGSNWLELTRANSSVAWSGQGLSPKHMYSYSSYNSGHFSAQSSVNQEWGALPVIVCSAYCSWGDGCTRYTYMDIWIYILQDIHVEYACPGTSCQERGEGRGRSCATGAWLMWLCGWPLVLTTS